MTISNLDHFLTSNGQFVKNFGDRKDLEAAPRRKYVLCLIISLIFHLKVHCRNGRFTTNFEPVL